MCTGMAWTLLLQNADTLLSVLSNPPPHTHTHTKICVFFGSLRLDRSAPRAALVPIHRSSGHHCGAAVLVSSG